VWVAEDDRPFALRLVAHIPDPGQVLTRYYGWYANRTRGMRRRQVPSADPPAVIDRILTHLRTRETHRAPAALAAPARDWPTTTWTSILPGV
jgi:hypothetical protein